MLVLPAIFAYLVFLVPAYYWLQQNYDLFQSLSSKFSPDLWRDLEREIISLKSFLLIGFALLILVQTFFVTMLLKKAFKPIFLAEKTLRKWTENPWEEEDLQNLTQEDLFSLCPSARYFLTHIKRQTEVDLDLLHLLKPGSNDPELYKAWKNLVERKKFYLKNKTLPIVARNSEPDYQRRAS